MKAIILTFCMTIVLVACSPRHGSQHGHGERDMFRRESYKKCMDEMEIKREDIKAMRQNKDPKLNCILSCAMIKEGMMDESGNLNSDNIEKVGLEIAKKKKPDLKDEEVKAALHSCTDKAKVVEDQCQKAKTFIDCAREHCKDAKKENEKSEGEEEA